MTLGCLANLIHAPDMLALGGSDLVEIIIVAVFVAISALGSILGKKKKEEEAERTRRPKKVPRAEGEQRPTDRVPPRRGAPERRPPRARPPRARPPQAERKEQALRDIMDRVEASQRQPERVPPVPGPQRRPPQQPPARRARRAEPVHTKPQAREARRRDASQVAQHTQEAVGEHAEHMGRHRAEEEARSWYGQVDMDATGTRRGETLAGQGLFERSLDRNDLRRAVVMLEVLRPPVSEREPEW